MKTMLEVAKRARVSKATVSRVLNGTGQVKQATRDAVFQAMEELGYRPNFLARALAHRTSNSIGLVISNFDGPYFGRLLRRAAEMAESHGKHLIVTDGHNTPQDEQSAVQLLADRQCDAIILYTRYMSETDLMALLNTLSIPMIVMNRDLPQARDRCIFFRQQQAAFDVVNYLIGQGHREIAFITALMQTPTAQARLAGYQQALTANHIAPEPRRIAYGTSMVDSGYQAARELLENGIDFSALFVSNDHMAIGAMKALYEAGKKLPQDVSLFGFDDEPSAAFLHPALSTVYMPIEEMIATAITQVLALVADKPVEPLQPFTGELKLRESVQKGPYFTV
ncbi:LacI family DNA-binding transcriptional regulator [Samsonia erythrinae]|uniref:LacI family transcriptional regulator n=1 Tax=Samsonia erythrinae TaxID=160434 RepID=A0A4R3VIB0_9GAMM|nr:LacI family DNA-binding transcriptional regulator [Samsonia erythrinae]TCV05393.1 LacI family transcriptional regulator [Samsonia erythrinae]